MSRWDGQKRIAGEGTRGNLLNIKEKTEVKKRDMDVLAQGRSHEVEIITDGACLVLESPCVPSEGPMPEKIIIHSTISLSGRVIQGIGHFHHHLLIGGEAEKGRTGLYRFDVDFRGGDGFHRRGCGFLVA